MDVYGAGLLINRVNAECHVHDIDHLLDLFGRSLGAAVRGELRPIRLYDLSRTMPLDRKKVVANPVSIQRVQSAYRQLLRRGIQLTKRLPARL